MAPISLKKDDTNLTRFNFFFKKFLFTYLCSKIINPYRKCNHYSDLIKKYKNTNTNILQKTISILEGLDENKDLNQLFYKSHLNTIYMTSLHVGRIFGDILFDKMVGQNEITSLRLKDMILPNKEIENNLYHIKNSIFEDIDIKNIKKRIF